MLLGWFLHCILCTHDQHRWNIDLEPQGCNCQCGATGTAADAVLYANWLAALHAALHAVNVRLTVDVATWSPVLSQFETLAPSVDRLMDMDTYNADSLGQWEQLYAHALNWPAVPSVSMGLGCYLDTKTRGLWSASEQSAVLRTQRALHDGVPEISMFILEPDTHSTNPPSWPEPFWWDVLRAYVTGTFPWPQPAISWWYVPDQNWPLMIDQIKPHLNVVTSVMIYCGVLVSPSGVIEVGSSKHCLDGNTGTIPALNKLGVRVEFWLEAASRSIGGYRNLWANLSSIDVMVHVAQKYDLWGWNIDLEPISSTTEDASLFVVWLATLKQRLNAIGVRLTLDVATWSPVLVEFETLAAGVNRLINMETYQGSSFEHWVDYYYQPLNITTVPRIQRAYGLGCWVDSTTNGTWSDTPASVTQRIAVYLQDKVGAAGDLHAMTAAGCGDRHVPTVARHRRDSARVAGPVLVEPARGVHVPAARRVARAVLPVGMQPTRNNSSIGPAPACAHAPHSPTRQCAHRSA